MKNVKIIIIIFFLIGYSALSFGQDKRVTNVKELYQENKYDSALSIINKLITNNAESDIVYYYKALCEFKLNLFDSTISSTTNALNLSEKSDSLYEKSLFLRSLSYMHISNLKLAIIDAEELVERFPENVNNLINLAYFYGMNKQFYNCLKTLKQAHVKDSNNITILINLAYYNCEVKDYESAIFYSSKGLKLSQDSSEIASLLNSRGLAIAKTISSDEGIKIIYESLTYKLNNSYSYFNLALIYLDKNEQELACQNFIKAKKLGMVNMTTFYIESYCSR